MSIKANIVNFLFLIKPQKNVPKAINKITNVTGALVHVANGSPVAPKYVNSRGNTIPPVKSNIEMTDLIPKTILGKLFFTFFIFLFTLLLLPILNSTLFGLDLLH